MKKDNKPLNKYIFVVGGVMSSVGKGIAAASVGKILQAKGYSVTALKIDPYINVDAGTMNPTEHGEVFVTKDSDETDQDIGNYERFLDIDITKVNYMTTGRVYLSVIEKERSMYYKGKCVEVVPHVPFEIIERINTAAKNAKADFTIVEIGGTVGEYQSMLFLEAVRMLKTKNPKDVITMMVSYLPIPSKVGEMKTKPTQYAVRTLNSAGIFPNFLLCRAERSLDEVRKEKLALACNIPTENIISAPDVDSIYDIPLNFEKEGLSSSILKELGVKEKRQNKDGLLEWKNFVKKTKSNTKQVRIAIIGKYFETGDFVLADSYLSVIEALKYSAYATGRHPVLTWMNALDFENNPKKLQDLKDFDGVLIPGGFGSRGVEGKLKVIEYVRKNKIPYFGICYGMQLMVIEYARNVLKLKDANTREVDPKSKNLVVDVMESQKENIEKGKYGGTMRLGAYDAKLRKGTIAYESYGQENISERHRHRFEVNNEYVESLENAGLVFSGKSPNGDLCEIAELPKKDHPFFLAVQFHPEFLARPLRPHSLFTAFIQASIKNQK